MGHLQRLGELRVHQGSRDRATIKTIPAIAIANEDKNAPTTTGIETVGEGIHSMHLDQHRVGASKPPGEAEIVQEGMLGGGEEEGTCLVVLVAEVEQRLQERHRQYLVECHFLEQLDLAYHHQQVQYLLYFLGRKTQWLRYLPCKLGLVCPGFLPYPQLDLRQPQKMWLSLHQRPGRNGSRWKGKLANGVKIMMKRAIVCRGICAHTNMGWTTL